MADPSLGKEVSFFDKLFSKDKASDEQGDVEEVGFFDRLIKKDKPAAVKVEATDAFADEPLLEPVKLTLHGGDLLDSLVEARGFPVDVDATIKWYRACAGGQLDELPNEGDSYRVAAADLGARICAQWSRRDGLLQSNFAQIGPLQFELIDSLVSAPPASSDAGGHDVESSSAAHAPALGGSNVDSVASSGSSNNSGHTSGNAESTTKPEPKPAAVSSAPPKSVPYPKSKAPAEPSSSEAASVGALNTRLQMSMQELELRRSQLERTKASLAAQQQECEALRREAEKGVAAMARAEQLQRSNDELVLERDKALAQVHTVSKDADASAAAVAESLRAELAASKESVKYWQDQHRSVQNGMHHGCSACHYASCSITFVNGHFFLYVVSLKCIFFVCCLSLAACRSQCQGGANSRAECKAWRPHIGSSDAHLGYVGLAQGFGFVMVTREY